MKQLLMMPIQACEFGSFMCHTKTYGAHEQSYDRVMDARMSGADHSKASKGGAFCGNVALKGLPYDLLKSLADNQTNIDRKAAESLALNSNYSLNHFQSNTKS